MSEKEQVLLDVLKEHGDFSNVNQAFEEHELSVIFDSMQRYQEASILKMKLDQMWKNDEKI